MPSLELQNFIISLLLSKLFTLTNLSQLVLLLISALFSHLHLIALLVPHFLSHLVVLRSLLVWTFLTLQSFPLHRSCGTVYLHTKHRHSVHHSTSSWPTSDTCISDISTSVAVKNFKSPLFHISIKICTHLGFSQRDISGIDPAWPFHFIFISYQQPLLHVIHQSNFLFVFTTQVFKDKLSLCCSTFISTSHQLHSILLLIITSSHNISLF